MGCAKRAPPNRTSGVDGGPDRKFGALDRENAVYAKALGHLQDSRRH